MRKSTVVIPKDEFEYDLYFEYGSNYDELMMDARGKHEHMCYLDTYSDLGKALREAKKMKKSLIEDNETGDGIYLIMYCNVIIAAI